MLIPIHCSDSSYPNKEPKQTVVYIEPELVVSVENILSPDGQPTGMIHIWTDNNSPTIVTETSLSAIASAIEHYYCSSIVNYNRDAVIDLCPFMFITSNIYLNVKHVAYVRESSDGSGAVIVYLNGGSAIILKDTTIEREAEKINAVLKNHRANPCRDTHGV